MKLSVCLSSFISNSWFFPDPDKSFGSDRRGSGSRFVPTTLGSCTYELWSAYVAGPSRNSAASVCGPLSELCLAWPLSELCSATVVGPCLNSSAQLLLALVWTLQRNCCWPLYELFSATVVGPCLKSWSAYVADPSRNSAAYVAALCLNSASHLLLALVWNLQSNCCWSLSEIFSATVVGLCLNSAVAHLLLALVWTLQRNCCWSLSELCSATVVGPCLNSAAHLLLVLVWTLQRNCCWSLSELCCSAPVVGPCLNSAAHLLLVLVWTLQCVHRSCIVKLSERCSDFRLVALVLQLSKNMLPKLYCAYMFGFLDSAVSF